MEDHNITIPTLEEFKETCQHVPLSFLRKQVDWYYTMSDDPNVYLKGQTESNRISTIIKLGGDDYLKVWRAEAEKAGVL